MYDILSKFLSNFIPSSSILIPICVALFLCLLFVILFKFIGGNL